MLLCTHELHMQDCVTGDVQEDRGLHQVSRFFSLYLDCEDRHLTAWLGGPLSPKDSPASTGSPITVTDMHGQARLFTWVLGIRTQFLPGTQQAPYLLSHLPSPKVLFL